MKTIQMQIEATIKPLNRLFSKDFLIFTEPSEAENHYLCYLDYDYDESRLSGRGIG
jgi:hypothetical protein